MLKDTKRLAGLMLLGWGDTADGTAFAMDNVPWQQQCAPQPPPASHSHSSRASSQIPE